MLLLLAVTLCSFAGSYHPAEAAVRLGYHGEVHVPKPTSLWNLVTLGFSLGQNFQLEAQAQSHLNIFEDKTWSTGNPRFGFSGLLVANEQWTLWADFNVEPAVTSTSRAVGKRIAPGSCQIVNIRLGDSGFSIGGQHWIRLYTYSTSLPWYDVYGNANPWISYFVKPGLIAQARVSLNYFHVKGLGWRKIFGEDLAFEPGLDWFPLPHLNLRPFVSVTPYKPGASALGLWITGQIDP